MGEYTFLTELHCHTAQVSSCGVLSARELVEAYAKAGYNTLVITDHLHWDGLKNQPKGARADWFLSGYEAAKRAAQPLGIKVLLGAEIRIESGSEDYLCFGLTPDSLGRVIDILESLPSLERLYGELTKMGLMLIQAHPFRPGLIANDGSAVDGIEVYNGNPRHDSRNAVAKAHAQSIPGAIMISGSDAHEIEDVANGGIRSREPIDTNDALLKVLADDSAFALIETPLG